MDTATSPIPEGLTEADYHLIRRALFDATYNVDTARKTTVLHTARGWTLDKLAALTPPYEGAPLQFIIRTKATPSGYANLGWQPIVGQTAHDAWLETKIPITRLVSVIYQKLL